MGTQDFIFSNWLVFIICYFVKRSLKNDSSPRIPKNKNLIVKKRSTPDFSVKTD